MQREEFFVSWVSTVRFVSRVAKKDGALAMAQPCVMCAVRIAAMKVRKVYFTINPTQYGVWTVSNDKYKIYTES
jgi:deoxycytidylate deaminase